MARLLAKGLLIGIWIPPQEIREARGLVAQRQKMVRLATQAKNRLHAVIQRHHLVQPAGNPFGAKNKEWWMSLSLGKLEKLNLQSDLETLQFAEQQVKDMTEIMEGMAAEQEEIGRLLHLAGFGVVTAFTVVAAIGDIRRFAEPKYLVGYAGLGTRVHDSGMTSRSGKITKAGRRDLRTVLVEAANAAANSHPHWKAELGRLEPRLGRNKAIVAIARKLLIAVWFVLQGKTDKYAEPQAVAQKMLKFAYAVGKANRPKGQTAAQFARIRMDALGLGKNLTSIPWGLKKPIPLPPSKLKERSDVQICNSACGDLKRFCGLIAPKSLYNLVNAFKQLFKSGSEALLFFRFLAQPCNHPILISSAPLTSHFICARFVSPFLWLRNLFNIKG